MYHDCNTDFEKKKKKTRNVENVIYRVQQDHKG